MNDKIHDRTAKAEEFLRRELESGSPGIQYVVLGADSTLFSAARGFASIVPARSLQESTTMMAYSMSKTITAAATLQLVERGALGLQDPITAFIPDISYGQDVTIRHLLAQTSGIPDPIPLKWVHLVEEHAQFDEQRALQAVLNQHAKLVFAPGSRYGYSNISYWLLGRVISKVTGTTYEDHVRQHVFRALDIPAAEMDFVIPSRENHAKGYLPKWSFMNLVKSFILESKYIGVHEGQWLHIKDHYLNGPAFGGIVASARAIGTFLQDQLADRCRLFSEDTRRLFFEEQTNTHGQPVAMTLGWHIGNNKGVRFFFKEGGGGGFHSEMRVYPQQKIASVIISNNTSYGVKRFLNSVDSEFLRR